jgi:predicted O-methyltransferase YrrM
MPAREAIRTLTRALRLPLHRRQAARRLAEFHERPRSLEEVIDAALDFGTHGLMKIKAQQIRAEILGLARAVRELEPRVILEIGTARGGTLLVWTQLASRHVISCDLRIAGYRRALYAQYPPPGSSCRVTLLEGDSHESAFRARVEQALGGDPVDFLFIDGDHTEAGVGADYRDYRGLVRPGGIIAFHDIVEKQPFPTNQVQHLWKRLKGELDTEEIVEDPHQCGFGIGLVRVPQVAGGTA